MDYNEMLEILRGKVLHESAEQTQHRLNEIADAVELLIRERDAIIEYIKNYHECTECKWENALVTDEPCRSCKFGCGRDDRWEWRGVQE